MAPPTSWFIEIWVDDTLKSSGIDGPLSTLEACKQQKERLLSGAMKIHPDCVPLGLSFRYVTGA